MCKTIYRKDNRVDMMHHLPMYIARYWIAVAVLFFTLLSAYTSSPMYGQSAPATPDVNTVPPIELLATPTNTPFPTPTPLDDDSQSGGGGGGLRPTATPVVDQNDGSDDAEESNRGGDSQNSDDNSHGSAGSTETGGSNGPTGGESATSTTADQATPPDQTGIVNVATLNIRRAPSTDAPIVDTIFLNEMVTIFSRDDGNRWWYVCCGSGSGREGWVSAQFITPDFAPDRAESLLPVSATTQNESQDERIADTLTVEMRPSPAFAWQGQTVQLRLSVRNRGEAALTKVTLRNDLPAELRYVDAVVGEGGTVQTKGNATEGLIYTISWPRIDAGETATATVTVRLAADLPNGALVDNLAVVESAEGARALAGITFAMPPLRLPLFR